MCIKGIRNTQNTAGNIFWVTSSQVISSVSEAKPGFRQEGSLRELFTNFEYITFLSCFHIRIIFYERFISLIQLWLEIIENIECSKAVWPSTVIYILYITRTDFEHHFSQLFFYESVLFYRDELPIKMFLSLGTKKMLYIQNWWTIPLKAAKF